MRAILVSLIFSRRSLGLVHGDASSGTTDLLSFVLCLLDGLARLLLLLREALANQSVLWLKLDHGFFVVVNHAESSALASAKGCFESEGNYQFRG